ncbi:DNA repair protein RadC [bacterium]|nr:DNA repair protein RadC [bacterium]
MKRRQAEFEALDIELMPREKLARYGIEALNLPELLALILGTGYGGKSVMELSYAIVRDYGSGGLKDLKDIDALRDLTGMPFVKASMLLASLELGRRLCGKGEEDEMTRITQPADVYPLTKDMWELEQEQLRGIYLNVASRVIGSRTLTVGTAVMSLADPATVFRPAIKLGAGAVILAHNHPSGELRPSEPDLKLTEEIAAAGELLHIKLLDHLIVTRNGFTSLLGAGLLRT